MNIRMTGLDWRKAPIGLREALSFTRSRVVELDRLLRAAEGVEARAEAGAEALDREIPLMITKPMPLARKDSGKALAQMENSGPLSSGAGQALKTNGPT